MEFNKKIIIEQYFLAFPNLYLQLQGQLLNEHQRLLLPSVSQKIEDLLFILPCLRLGVSVGRMPLIWDVCTLSKQEAGEQGKGVPWGSPKTNKKGICEWKPPSVILKKLSLLPCAAKSRLLRAWSFCEQTRPSVISSLFKSKVKRQTVISSTLLIVTLVIENRIKRKGQKFSSGLG